MQGQTEKPYMIEQGVYKIPLVLPASLEPQRKKFDKTLAAAQKRLKNFAEKNGWEAFIKENFVDHAEIFDNKNRFDQTFLKLHDEKPSTKLPKTVSAALEKRIFIAVSPKLYSKNYPEGIEEKSFEKLITHEMAHRLHIRILDGDEHAMGPVWFYEGFAIYAAGQFEKSRAKLNSTEIWEIIKKQERGSYKNYSFLFRYFLTRVCIHDLVERAGKKDFLDWLRQVDNQ